MIYVNQDLFKRLGNQKTVIYIKDVEASHVEILLEYMYKGEIKVQVSTVQYSTEEILLEYIYKGEIKVQVTLVEILLEYIYKGEIKVQVSTVHYVRNIVRVHVQRRN